MKNAILGFLVLMSSFSCFAQLPPMNPQSKVVTDSLFSKVLNANRRYSVYLPKSYETEHHRRYPVLYLLHGMTGTNISWFKDQCCKDVMDQLTASGETCEMIIVSPDAGGDIFTGAWNGYFDMPGWPYETFFYQEFLPFIETSFRIMNDKEHRAIAGLSMGGGGATSYAQRYPDLYCAAYAMSALMDIPAGAQTPSSDPMDKMALLSKAVIDNSCIRYVLDADEKRKEQLAAVKWYVDCGDDDFLLNRNLEFFQAMQNASIPCQLRVRDGGHTSEYWHSALYCCLPFVSRSFGK